MAIDGVTMSTMATNLGYTAQAEKAVAVAVLKKALDIEKSHVQQLLATLSNVPPDTDGLLGQNVNVHV